MRIGQVIGEPSVRRVGSSYNIRTVRKKFQPVCIVSQARRRTRKDDILILSRPTPGHSIKDPR
jgi:hypothetical protein